MNAKASVLLCAPLFATGLAAQHTTRRPEQPDFEPMAGLPASHSWGDFDGDGLRDVFVLAAGGGGRLLRNVGGEDATDASGLAALARVEAHWMSTDPQGGPSLHVISLEGERFFHNAGKHFEEVPLDPTRRSLLAPLTPAPPSVEEARALIGLPIPQREQL